MSLRRATRLSSIATECAFSACTSRSTRSILMSIPRNMRSTRFSGSSAMPTVYSKGRQKRGLRIVPLEGSAEIGRQVVPRDAGRLLDRQDIVEAADDAVAQPVGHPLLADASELGQGGLPARLLDRTVHRPARRLAIGILRSMFHPIEGCHGNPPIFRLITGSGGTMSTDGFLAHRQLPC